jgi:Tn3 transposase DDE domain
VQYLRQKRRIIPNDMLKHVSPLSWEHINLTGIYTWDEPPSFADSGFRPRRTSTTTAQAA